MEKITKFSKPFDKRHTDPSKNYGIGSAVCWMILKGDKGAVQFSFSTGIYPPNVLAEWKAKGYVSEPMGYDVGYHSPTPIYDGQDLMGKCDLLDGDCYYDGSSLRAEEWFKIFMEDGYERIWEMLEDYYKELFEND